MKPSLCCTLSGCDSEGRVQVRTVLSRSRAVCDRPADEQESFSQPKTQATQLNTSEFKEHARSF